MDKCHLIPSDSIKKINSKICYDLISIGYTRQHIYQATGLSYDTLLKMSKRNKR
jgi:hypothetical protein